MRSKTLLIVFLVGFLGLCTGLVIESGLFSNAHLHGIVALAQETEAQIKSTIRAFQRRLPLFHG